MANHDTPAIGNGYSPHPGCDTHLILEFTKIQGNSDTATNSQDAAINATPTVGITNQIALPKMADSPKITTWLLQEIKHSGIGAKR